MKLKQIIITLFGCVIGTTSIFLTHSPVFAQTVFSDDFSSEYEKWQDVRNTFDFDMWSIIDQKSDVFVNKYSTLAEIIPKNEYWDESWKNYIYKLDYIYLKGADKALSFWFQDVLNFYQFHFVGNNYILSHIQDGVEIWKKSGPLVLEVGKKHKMETHLNDGNIKFFLDGFFRFEYDDPTFENDHGRIGLKVGAGNIMPTHVQFDNVEVSLITDLFDVILPITDLKQTDPLWSDIEYDSAITWATLGHGIGDWGCLITSINMVLNYHNITQFTDGTSITPETLNTWLIQQDDGYIFGGLVNWSAITRLVKEIHETTGSVNLEYSRIAGNSLETAIEEINAKRPVILEIPGHFIVGSGITQNQDDLIISDPAYDYSLLSEHEKELLSTRLLTPSNTDLSYIHMAHDDSITVSITNLDEVVPENYQTYNQSLTSFINQELSPIVNLHELAKPDTGKYLVTVSTQLETPQPFTLTIFAYDVDANLSNLTFSGIAGTKDNPTVLSINYNKNGPSELQTNTTFTTLHTDIQDLTTYKEISRQYVSFELIQLLNAVITASTTNKPRYINAISQTVNWYSNFISESAKGVINQRLSEIQKDLQ